MNEQQKDFTIKEIESYEEQIADLETRINRNALFTFLGVGLAVGIFAIKGEFSNNEILDNLIGVSSSGLAIYNGIAAVKRICEKTSLDHTVRVLEYALNMNELAVPDKNKINTR